MPTSRAIAKQISTMPYAPVNVDDTLARYLEAIERSDLEGEDRAFAIERAKSRAEIGQAFIAAQIGKLSDAVEVVIYLCGICVGGCGGWEGNHTGTAVWDGVLCDPKGIVYDG